MGSCNPETEFLSLASSALAGRLSTIGASWEATYSPMEDYGKIYK